MSYTPTPPGYPPPSARPGRGMAIAALVLGIVALLTFWFCLGILLAVVGLVIGIIAAVRGEGRGMAITGIVLSVLTLVLTFAVGGWFYSKVKDCANTTTYPTQADRERCVEDKFPFVNPTPTP